MTKFKVGDRVVRTALHLRHELAVGDCYMVSGVNCHGHIWLEGYHPLYCKDYFKLDISQRHKHYDMIVAWAEGEEIEILRVQSQEWQPAPHPSWILTAEYRIKPKTQQQVEIERIESELREMAISQQKLADDFKELKG